MPPRPARPAPAAQVATDTRLWLYGQLQLIRAALRDLIAAAADRAEAEVDVLMPGFTHLQPAQVRCRGWGRCQGLCGWLALRGARCKRQPSRAVPCARPCPWVASAPCLARPLAPCRRCGGATGC